MCCGPVCVALVQGIPAGLVTLTVGILAWLIARRQAVVAEAKFKLDLFDKRLPIFQQTWEIMSEVVMKGARAKNYDLGNPFSNFIPHARFLFGPEVEQYLSDAVKKWTDLWAFEGERADPAAMAQNAAKKAELKRWFFEQASTGVKELFAPYLDFDEWRSHLGAPRAGLLPRGFVRRFTVLASRWLNAFGLLLGTVGVIIAWHWGFPQPPPASTLNAIIESSGTPHGDGKTAGEERRAAEETEQHYKHMSELGLSFILAGFLCQLLNEIDQRRSE